MLKTWLNKGNKKRLLTTKLLSRNEDIERKMRQYREMAEEIIEYCGDLKNKAVLEVGSGAREECLSKYLNDNYDLHKAVAIDPVVKKPRKIDETFEIRQEDIRNLKIEDNTFDIIVSIAAFEHIPDFEKAIKEMYRVLKPGGVLYTKFGPIWSGPWGHHLWVQCEDQLYNYTGTHLPAYCHLLMTYEELMEHCLHNMEIPQSAAEKIVDFVHHSKDQNRLYYSDYENIFSKSEFEILFFFGSNQFPLKDGYSTDNYKSMMLELTRKFPEKSGWTYNAIYCMLHKPED